MGYTLARGAPFTPVASLMHLDPHTQSICLLAVPPVGDLSDPGGQSKQGRKVPFPVFAISPPSLPQSCLATSMPPLNASYSPPVWSEAGAATEKGLQT